MEFAVLTSSHNSTPVLSLVGEVDIATVPRCSDAINKFVHDNSGLDILIDLSHLTALDDTGLGIILGAAGSARNAGGDIALVVTDERMRQRLDITGMSRALRVLGSLSET
jgi:anti-anti-sigma factor